MVGAITRKLPNFKWDQELVTAGVDAANKEFEQNNQSQQKAKTKQRQQKVRTNQFWSGR